MILNLTQHAATPAQIEGGVVDLGRNDKKELEQLLTFTEIPTSSEVDYRVERLVGLAVEHPCIEDIDAVMIGGAPWLMAPLEKALSREGLTPLYAFSRRESVEVPQEDGSLRKTAVFRHVGFVGGSS